jgi:DNA-binding IclR family transcriptional regulator
MTYTIPIRHLLALRPDLSDQTILDYLDLTTMARQPGQMRTLELQHRWQCSQPTVSRRVLAITRAGLADITAGHGAYQVRWTTGPGAA